MAQEPLGARHRITPRISVGIGVWAVYTAIVTGLMIASGVPYEDLFASPENARVALISLAAGSTLLIVFLLWARWDMIFRDPARLPMSKFLWSLPVLFVALLIVRFAGMEWAAVDRELLLCIVAAGVLVGFAEETLSRGVFLRSARDGRHSEAWACVMTAVFFGLLHLPNAFMGIGAIGVFQVFLACFSGVNLYLWRRATGSIVPAMVAHGTWDISTFLDGQYGQGPAHNASMYGTLVLAGIAFFALIVIARGDRSFRVTPEGIEPTDGERH